MPVPMPGESNKYMKLSKEQSKTHIKYFELIYCVLKLQQALERFNLWRVSYDA